MKIERVVPCNPDQWDAIYSGCEYATHFHSRAWAELWHSYSPVRWQLAPRLLTFSDGKTALLPFTVERRFGGLLTTCLSSPAGTYGGWLSAHELKRQHTVLLQDHLRTSYSSLTWRLNPYQPHIADLDLTDYVPDDTDALDLSVGFDGLHRRWSKGHAAASRQARNAGVTVRCAVGLSDWKRYYECYRDTVRRWGKNAGTVYPWKLIELIADENTAHSRLWLAEYGGRLIAGALCFYAHRHAVYWHGAALQAYLRLRPVHLIIHEAVRHACNHGYRWFDLNPSGRLEGVRKFKRGFGATRLNCPVFTRSATAVGFMKTLISTLST